MIYTLLSFFLVSAAFAEDDPFKGKLPLDSFETGSDGIVDGCVNVISGAFMHSQVDISIAGPEPVYFERSYSSAPQSSTILKNGWRHNCEEFVSKMRGYTGQLDHYIEARLLGGHGCSIRYTGWSNPTANNLLDLQKESYETGVTNIAHGTLTGQNSIKNTALYYSRKNKTFTSKTGDGTEKLFNLWKKGDRYGVYTLSEETRPNHYKLKYSYGTDVYLAKIEVKNPSNKSIGYLSFFPRSEESFKKCKSITVQSSDGQVGEYQFDKVKDTTAYILKKASSTCAPEESYSYERPHAGSEKKHSMLMTRYERPDNRFKEIEYYSKRGEKIQGKDIDCKNHLFRINLVKTLKAPCGTTSSPILTHSFNYKKFRSNNSPSSTFGKIYVEDALGRRTVYFHLDDYRLHNVTKYSDRDKKIFLSKEQYFFTKCDSPLCGQLMGRALLDRNDTPLVAKMHQYDEQGNVTRDEIWGNISGGSTRMGYGQRSPQDNGCEKNITAYTYSENSYNLVMSKTDHSGHKTIYRYAPASNILTAKFESDPSGIVHREFYTYDENQVITVIIEDDGASTSVQNLAGVTFRKVTAQTNNHQGFPIQQIHSYLDLSSGELIQLTRYVNDYNRMGKRVSQKIFDANENECSTLLWEYDAHGNVIKEVDALGNVIQRQYDANDNCIKEIGPSQLPEKFYSYDFMNRLIREEEVHSNGTRYAVTHKYDYVGNRIETIDPQGNKTKFTYDGLNRLIKEEQPKLITSSNTVSIPIRCASYDELGFPITKTDAEGNTTQATYNIFGKPLLVVDPLGNTVKTTYNLDGTPKEIVDADGNRTELIHDAFHNVIYKALFDPSGALIEERSYRFKGSRLLKEVDPAGIVTSYHYDEAGRPAGMSRLDTHTTVHYDALGRGSEVRRFANEQEYLATIEVFDVAGRKIEERIEDQEGSVYKRTTNSYDAVGNCIQTALYTDAGAALTCHEYDKRGRITLTITPDGKQTRIFYNDFFIDRFGCTVTKITAIDCVGGSTETIYNTHGKEAEIERYDAYGALLAHKELYYTPTGRLSQTIEHAISPLITRKIRTEYHYDRCGRLTQIIEAGGKPEQKITSYAYTATGLGSQIQKPDGVILYTDYDPLKRICRHYDSLGTIDYQYSYDQLSNPICILDAVNATAVERSYDQNCHLTAESYLGITLSYTYDTFGNKKSMTYPDGSSVVYAYRGPHLSSVSRYTAQGDHLFTHQYTHYDQSGALTRQEFPFGTFTTTCDLMGRTTRISGPGYRQDLSYDELGNVHISGFIIDQKTAANRYTYDALNQLTSEAGAVNHTYINDSLHNHVQVDGYETSLNHLNQLLEDRLNTHTYDLRGNRTQTGNTVYTYDTLERLIKVETPLTTITFTYDALHRRLTKTDSASTTTYIYCEQIDIGSYKDEKLQELRILGRGLASDIGATIAIEKESTPYFTLSDHNGNIRALFTKDGYLHESYRYSAFGTEITSDNPTSPWRFSSKRVDPETSLVYFGRRFYDPATCRWLNADPLGLTAGPNLYAYVKNNPLSYFDEYGLDWQWNGGGGPPSCSYKHAPHRQIQLIIHNIGHALNFISAHLIPIPIIRDCIGTVGGFFAGQGLRWRPDYSATHSHHEYMKGGQKTKDRFVSGNGIVTSVEEDKAYVEAISKYFGDVPVTRVYNATHGFTSDVLECGAQILGIPTHSATHLAYALRQEMQYLESGGVVKLFCHSQGGLVSYRALQYLTPEERKRVEVTSFGSAKIISSEGLAGAVNIINSRDHVTWADFGNRVKAQLGRHKDVRLIQSKTGGFFDHDRMGATYLNELKILGLKYQKIPWNKIE